MARRTCSFMTTGSKSSSSSADNSSTSGLKVTRDFFEGLEGMSIRLVSSMDRFKVERRFKLPSAGDDLDIAGIEGRNGGGATAMTTDASECHGGICKRA